MSTRPRYDSPSEYGGSDGGNYHTPAGTPRALSPGERARLLRTEGISDPGRPGESERAVYDPFVNPDPESVQLAPGFRP